jgi:hypothetical protein
VKEQFISEAIEPVGGDFDVAAMATGMPGLPARFRWRDEELEIAELLDAWKGTGAALERIADRYLRKHWYHVRLRDGRELKLYFERQPRGAGKTRWWLYALLAD